MDAREGDTLGLLYDVDKGSIEVYKNGVRLGMTISSRLTPPLVSFFLLFAASSYSKIYITDQH
jgi:hypothetical protein